MGALFCGMPVFLACDPRDCGANSGRSGTRRIDGLFPLLTLTILCNWEEQEMMKFSLSTFFVVGWLGLASWAAAEAPLAHMVFFTLAEDTPDHRAKLVKACEQLLTGHEGTLYFSAGTIAEEFDRDVNDREFDVALHLVFASKAAHDIYQTHPRHLQFIDENKQLWSKVRVFDSYLPVPKSESLPAGTRGFAGMLRGKAVAHDQGQLLVEITEVSNVWRHSKAETPRQLVGKKVLVGAQANAEKIGRFLQLVQPGETLQLDVAHRDGDTLILLELTEEQRQRVK